MRGVATARAGETFHPISINPPRETKSFITLRLLVGIAVCALARPSRHLNFLSQHGSLLSQTKGWNCSEQAMKPSISMNFSLKYKSTQKGTALSSELARYRRFNTLRISLPLSNQPISLKINIPIVRLARHHIKPLENRCSGEIYHRMAKFFPI
jgi:hypothetical protein